MNRRKRHIYQAWHNYVLDCSLNFQEEYKVDGFNDDKVEDSFEHLNSIIDLTKLNDTRHELLECNL